MSIDLNEYRVPSRRRASQSRRVVFMSGSSGSSWTYRGCRCRVYRASDSSEPTKRWTVEVTDTKGKKYRPPLVSLSAFEAPSRGQIEGWGDNNLGAELTAKLMSCDRIMFNTTPYVKSHFGEPMGNGTWLFCTEEEYQAGQESNRFSHNGSYEEAKQAAARHYRDLGTTSVIIVCQ